MTDAYLQELVNCTRSTWLEEHCATSDEASLVANAAHSRLSSMAVELAKEVLALRKQLGARS